MISISPKGQLLFGEGGKESHLQRILGSFILTLIFIFGADKGNQTLNFCLEGKGFIIKLHPHLERVEGIEPSSSAWKAEILAIELHPHFLYCFFYLIWSGLQDLNRIIRIYGRAYGIRTREICYRERVVC